MPFMQQELSAKESSQSTDIDVFKTYAPLVGSVCRRYLKRRHDIEDAMQDTFVKMVAHGMDASCPRLAGWLSAAAHTSCVDQLRRAGSEQRRRLGWSLAHTAGDDDALTHQELCQRIEEALLQLDEPSRRLLIERFYEQTPLHVIARRTGVSVSTVSRWGTAALRTLAAVLRDMGLIEQNSAPQLAYAD
jgi:RNA polymerase sigma factor (sigma-70 family)